MNKSIKFEDLKVRDYLETWNYQESLFTKLVEQKRDLQNSSSENPEGLPNYLIFVEHPHVYTLGKSGSENNLLLDQIQLKAKGTAFYRTNRGGDITYHGPGQIVGYPILDLDNFNMSLRDYIFNLEESIILTLEKFGVIATRLTGASGVWIDPDVPGKTRKICAIGVRASRNITMHGFAFNINTDLSYFNFINPCGFTDKGVTSLSKEKGELIDFEKVKLVLLESMREVFRFELNRE